jgi:Flp pilus assembly protein TadB
VTPSRKAAADPVIALFLLLVIAAIVLGIFGVVVQGLVYLLLIGIAMFLGALLLAALRMRRRPGRRQAR